MPFGIGPLELVIILAIILLAFGAKRLPEIGRSLGSGMREFKTGITGERERDEDAKKHAEALAASTTTDESRPPV